MRIHDLYFPDDLYYDEHHQWARTENGLVSTGITDYAQNLAGDVVFVELPRPGTTVVQGEAMGSMESGKWVGKLYAPVSGTVVEANEALNHSPRTLNKDPYGEGWIARIQPNDPTELNTLMRGEALRRFVQAELERDGVEGKDEHGEP